MFMKISSTLVLLFERFFKKGSELALGTGAFVAGLEFSGDCQAEVVGKPSKAFFDLAVDRFGGVAAGEVLMVGDDVRDDVIGDIIVGDLILITG